MKRFPRSLEGLSSITLLFIAFFALIMAGSQEARVFASTNQCKVVLSIDRSGSISDTQWEGMGTAISDLMEYGVIVPGVNIDIAIWTFSHGDPNGDYNWPHSSGYIRAGYGGGVGSISQQKTLIETVFGVSSFGPSDAKNYTPRDGGTDYQQAFGYSTYFGGGSPTLNSSIRGIVNGNPDALLLITDGAPNYPGGINGNSGLDNNSIAIAEGKKARNMYSNIPVYGAFVADVLSDTIPIGLKQTVNGPSDVVGPVEYTNIARFLDEKITDACGNQVVVTPDEYELFPTISATSHKDSPSNVNLGDSTYLTASVNNTGITSSDTNWKMIQVVVPLPGPEDPPNANTVAVTAATSGFGQYKDDDDSDNCNFLDSVGVKGICSVVRFKDGAGATGTRVFTPAVTTMPSFGEYETVSGAALGEQVCYFLVLNTPTQDKDSPKYRYSRGDCIEIVPPPYYVYMQIHGGDLRVGRSFDDTTGKSGSKVYTQTYLRYGSWTEYGIFAPNIVMNAASNSGYRSASPIWQDCNNTNVGSLVRLTFANDVSGCGRFGAQYMGKIPFDDSAFKVSSPSVVNAYFDVTNSGGVINLSSKRKIDRTVVIFEPGKDVSIKKDIEYTNDHTGIDDIPQVVIMANNISIDEGVGNVDAWLVANGASGNISTCNNVYSVTVALKISDCNRQLTVNGPVMAKSLYLRRTANAPAQNGAPAEVFNLRGTEYLWAYNMALNQGRGAVLQTVYSTELPPYY